MLAFALVYELACGDIEVSLHDANGGSIVLVDAAGTADVAIIAALRAAARHTETWESDQPDVLSVSHLEF